MPEKKVEEYKLVQVPTQYGIAIQNPDETTMSVEEAMVVILNKLEKIQLAVA